MGKLVAPELTREWVIAQGYGRHFSGREFRYPHGLAEWRVWGAKSGMPSIIFPFTNDEKVVALYQFRHGSNSFVYELPGGMPETAGERGEDAGLRELIEETGYRPKMVEVLRPSIAFDPASCTTSFVPVLAIGCEKFEEAKFDKLEIAEVREFPLDTWLHMVRYEPVDSKSAALTLCALLHLGYHLTRS